MREITARERVREASSAWLAYMEFEKGLLPSTVTAYRRELRFLWRRYQDRILDLTTEDIRQHLIAAGGKPSTIGGRVAAFRSFFGFLVWTDRRLDDPTVKLRRPRIHRGMPKPVEDRARILAALCPKMRLVATLLAETGLRISEACALNVAVPAPEQIHVRGKGDKERLVLLTPAARASLDSLGGRMPYKKRSIQRRFQIAGTHAHAWRHTLACDLAASGADLGDVQEILGHASPATTKVYMQYQTDRLWAAQERREAALVR